MTMIQLPRLQLNNINKKQGQSSNLFTGGQGFLGGFTDYLPTPVLETKQEHIEGSSSIRRVRGQFRFLKSSEKKKSPLLHNTTTNDRYQNQKITKRNIDLFSLDEPFSAITKKSYGKSQLNLSKVNEKINLFSQSEFDEENEFKSSTKKSRANLNYQPSNPFLELNKMKSTSLINNVQKKLLENIDEIKDKKLQALGFIKKMQESKDSYQLLLDQAEKAGIYSRHRNSSKYSKTSPGNQYYYNYIHDKNNAQLQQLQNNKSEQETNYLPYQEIKEMKQSHQKRVQYYMKVLPDEIDFKLKNTVQQEILNITRFDDFQVKKLNQTSQQSPKDQNIMGKGKHRKVNSQIDFKAKQIQKLSKIQKDMAQSQMNSIDLDIISDSNDINGSKIYYIDVFSDRTDTKQILKRNMREGNQTQTVTRKHSPLKLMKKKSTIIEESTTGNKINSTVVQEQKQKLASLLKRRATVVIYDDKFMSKGIDGVDPGAAPMKSFHINHRSHERSYSINFDTQSVEGTPRRGNALNSGLQTPSQRLNSNQNSKNRRKPNNDQSRASNLSSHMSFTNQSNQVMAQLESSKQFQNFFLKMAEDDSVLRWSKLNKNNLKQFLQDRYGKRVSERMLSFLENTFGSLYRIDFKTFVKLLKDFVRGGPQLWLRFAFNSFNITGNGMLCEHDMFQILEQFKQRDVIYFYKELFNKKQIPNDFRQNCDESDRIFFEAFNKDFALISKAFSKKKQQIEKQKVIDEKQNQSKNQSSSPSNKQVKSKVKKVKTNIGNNFLTFITRMGENGGSPELQKEQTLNVNIVQESPSKLMSNSRQFSKENESKFDHYKDTHTQCVGLSSEDFYGLIKFENNLAQITQDFIKSITCGLINLRDIAMNSQKDDIKTQKILSFQRRQTLKRLDITSDIDIEDDPYFENLQHLSSQTRSIYLINNQHAIQQQRSQKFVIYFIKQLLKNDYENILKSFRLLTVNPENTDVLQLSMTYQSCYKNMVIQDLVINLKYRSKYLVFKMKNLLKGSLCCFHQAIRKP
eukprot:403376443